MQELAELDRQAWRTIGSSYKESTKENIKSQYDNYKRFCKYFYLKPFPTDSWQLVRCAQFLSNEGKRPGTIANIISTVCTLHALKGYQSPELYDITIKLQLKGLHNISGKVTKQAEVMTPQMLLKIAKLIDPHNVKEVVSFTALLTGFYLLLRKSNLVPTNMTGKKGFDPDKQLQRRDLRIGDITILVDLKWTKTVQNTGRKLQLPLLPLVSDKICAIAWLKRMVKLVPGKAESPLFMIPSQRDSSQMVPLTYKKLGDQLKSWAIKVKGSKDGWTLHCLRRGGATWCFNIDVSSEAIRLMGDWAGDSYKRYLDMDIYKRADTMKKFTEQIDKICL